MDQLDQPFGSSSGSRTLDCDPLGGSVSTPKSTSNDHEMTMKWPQIHGWLSDDLGETNFEIFQAHIYPCWGILYIYFIPVYHMDLCWIVINYFRWSFIKDGPWSQETRQPQPLSEPPDLSWALPREAGQPFVLCQQNIVLTGYLKCKPQSLNSAVVVLRLLGGVTGVIPVLTIELKIDHSQNSLRERVQQKTPGC